MTTATTTAPTFTAEDVRAVTGDVWEACLLQYGDTLEWGTGEPLEGDVVQALIRITGDWNGVITLGMAIETARTAARVMLNADEVEPEEVADAVGELVNIIGGSIKSLLPTPSKLSLPEVTRTAADTDPAAYGSAVEHCRVDLSWGPRPILVRVWS